MKYVILLFLFSISLTSPAQEQALEISKIGSEQTRIFKENKRVKIKTIEGDKFIGRLQIVNPETIEIKGNIIPLNSISNIKNRSVVAGVAGTLLIITGPFIMTASPIAALISGSSAGFLVLSTGVAVTLSGIFFNEFARNYRNNKWTYKITEE